MALNEGRRPGLAGLQPDGSQHVGLWISRYLSHQTWHGEGAPTGYDKEVARRAKDVLIDQVAQKALPQGYKVAFDAWKQELSNGDKLRVATATATAPGRVIIGIGQKGPAEFGISLHHTWGMPILPGSSLKGIAALGAHCYLEGDTWRRRPSHAKARDGGPNAYDALFGDVEEQGAVIFHDAWLVPRMDRTNGLHRDVLTVHHPDYYQRDAAPSDTDSPIPVPFLTASGEFLVALELHPALLRTDEHLHWLEAAWQALRAGLAHHGIGAKTNAGYGRVGLPDWAETTVVQELQRRQREQVRQQQLAARRAMDPPGRAADVIASTWPGEGSDGLVAWLKSAGQPPLDDLVAEEAQVVAAAHRLFEAGHGSGLKKASAAVWQDWVERGLKDAFDKQDDHVVGPGEDTTLLTKSDAEIQTIFRRNWNSGKHAYRFDKIAKTFLDLPLDVDSLQRAIDALKEAKAKDRDLAGLETKLATLRGSER